MIVGIAPCMSSPRIGVGIGLDVRCRISSYLRTPQPMHEVKFVPFCNDHFLGLANLSNERVCITTS